jgi:REP element-mobilizing transposase RayT
MKKSNKKKSKTDKPRQRNTFFLTTLCTEKGNEYFGKMKNGKMEPVKTGIIAKEMWEAIPENYENIGLDDFVLMPNHLHGIISCKCGNGEKQILKALEKSIYVIEEYRRSVKEKVLKANSRSSFGWARNFNIYNIKDENELYDMRYYIEKEAMKWEFDSENTRNKLYITKGTK